MLDYLHFIVADMQFLAYQKMRVGREQRLRNKRIQNRAIEIEPAFSRIYLDDIREEESEIKELQMEEKPVKPKNRTRKPKIEIEKNSSEFKEYEKKK